jgi:hypothetical protein
LFALCTLIFNSIQAQSGAKGKFTGKSIDEITQEIIPFSSIRLMSGNPQKAIAGTIGNEKGDFVVEAPYGTYDLIIESVGFEPITLKNQILSK